jgi:hypothetical protein
MDKRISEGVLVMNRIKLQFWGTFVLAAFRLIAIQEACAQQDSIIIKLSEVYYDSAGQKHDMTTVSATIFLGRGPKLPLEFTPSLMFGGVKEQKDYRIGSASSDFYPTWYLREMILPFPPRVQEMTRQKRMTPCLIYNFLIRPKRIAEDLIHITLAYEKSEFLNFSKNNHPCYERSFYSDEFDLRLDQPRELFCVSTAPNKVAAEIMIQGSIRPPIESKISTNILEVLASLKPIEIPVTFHIEYVRKDNTTGQILFRKQTIQQGYSRDNPFSLDFLIETPEIFRQNDRELNYAIRGYLVPLKRVKDELKIFLIMEQRLMHGPGYVGQDIKKELSLNKNEKLEIELRPNSGYTGFESKSGKYVDFYYDDLFKGCSESLLLTVDF